MRKLSEIIESIWSDMQDRSSGDVVRKEDMIITNEELKNRIQKLYKEQGEGETLDVSSLTNLINRCYNFTYIFEGYRDVIQIIGLEDWDVSHVEDMDGMFMGCKNFNSDLSKWDVSKVINMSYMFLYCINFNSDLSKWNVRKVTDMKYMFDDCKSLKKIPSWYYTQRVS